MSAFQLVIPMAALPSSNHRDHWRVTAKKRAAMRAAAALACTHLQPIDGPVHLTITFGFPDRRRRDLDNYEVKSAIDGMVDAGVITEDNSRVLRAVTRRPAEHLSAKGHAVIVFDLEPVAS